MVPYFVTSALVLVFSVLAEISRTNDLERGYEGYRHSKRTGIFLFLTLVPLVYTAGFRYGIGTDFMGYYKINSVFKANFWKALISLNEPGICLLRDLVSLFSTDGAAYIFTFSLLTILSFCIVLFRHTDDYVFAMMLYIFCGCWHGAFNGVRQYLAAAVLMMGIHFIREKKLIPYAVTVFIAFLFHKSSIVMIVPYFVMRNEITPRNILFLAAGTLIVSLNYETVFAFIGFLKEKDVVMNSYATSSVNILRVLANAAPAVAAVVLNLGKELDEEQTFCINGLIINAVAMIASANSTYLARIGVYTGVFIPLCLSKVIRLKNKNFELFFRTAIVVLFAVFWYVEVSGHSALNPFKWVFYKGIFY